MLYNDLLYRITGDKRPVYRTEVMKNLALITLGAAIGAAAVALTTPKNGENLRNNLKKSYDNTLYNLKFKGEELKEQVMNTVEEGKEKIDNMKTYGQNIKEDLTSNVKSAMSETDNEIEDYSYRLYKDSNSLDNYGKVVADDVKEAKDELYNNFDDESKLK